MTDEFEVRSWSATEFTDALGTPVDSYAMTGGANTAYLSLWDRDQNTNSLVIDTVTVVVTNAGTADYETRILYETGPDTGIFTNSLALSTTAGIPEDESLHLNSGDSIQVLYSDPEDSVDNATDSAASLSPALILYKTVSLDGSCPGVETVQAMNGADVTYCLVVTNAGDVAITNITVTDNDILPVLSTNIGDLAVGQSYTVSVDRIALVDLTNTATATGYDPNGDPVTDDDDAVVDAIAPQLTLDKTVSIDGSVPGAQSVQATNGTVVTYSFVVANAGDVAVTNITVTDNDIVPVLSTNIGDLAVGQSYTVNVDRVALADLTNTATATGYDPNGDPVTDDDDAVVDAIAPQLQLEKTVSLDGSVPGVQSVQATNGTVVTYSFIVANAGDVAVTNIVVTDNDILPMLSTNIGDLAVGQVTTVSVTRVVSGDLTNTATATGYDPNGDPWTDDDTAEVDEIAPQLTLDKTVSIDGSVPGAQSVQATNGTVVTYSFVVANAGDVAVTNITVTDNDILPVLSTNIGDLAVGQSYTVNVDRIALADLTNTATATGYDPNGDPVSDDDDAVVDLIDPVLVLDKTVSIDGSVPGVQSVQATNGAVVTYSFVVTNAGDVAITNITVTDNDILPVLSTNIGDLAVGQAYTVSVDTVISGDLTNTATATGYDPNGDPWTDDDTSEVDEIAPALTIAKTVSLDEVVPGIEAVQGTNGAAVTYCFVVTNAGDVAITNITVTDSDILPVLSTNIGDLAVGQAYTVSVDTVISGDLTNTATATGYDPNGDPWGDTDTAEVDEIAPAIAIAKTVSLDGSVPGVQSIEGTNGAAVTYSFVVSNAGDVTITNITVTDNDILPVLSTNIGDLAVGQAYTVSVATVISGDLTNTATATGYDPNGDPWDDTDTAEVDEIEPALTVDKTVSIDGAVPGVQSIEGTNGAAVTYSFVVSNAGDVTITNITVTDNDILPVLSTNIGDLAIGGAYTVSVTRTVSGDLTNTATATGYDPNGEPVSDTDDAVVDEIAPQLTLDKTVSIDGSVPGVELVRGMNGQAVTYSFVVTNGGDVAVTNITVTDNDITPTLSTNIGDLAVGEVVTVSVVRAISGDLTNTATVTGYDPNGDPVSDTDDAEVGTLKPSYILAKTLLLPSDRPADVGEEVVFVLSVTNSGETVLDPVRLDDTFDTNYVVYSSSAPVADTVDPAGALTWLNVGPLAVGEAVTVTARYTAVASTTPGDTTNVVASTVTTTNGIPVAPQTNSAPVEALQPAYALSKTLLSPSGRPADVGEEVVFLLSVTNTGETVLDPVRLDDTFDTNYVVYSSSAPLADTIDPAGALTWLNVGPLAIGEAVTVTARYTAVASTTPGDTTNIVASTVTTTNGVPVASQNANADVSVVRPSYALTKTLLVPANDPIEVSQAVWFAIVVTNDGETVLDPVPLTDMYDPTVLSFVGASVPASTSMAGRIEWDNLGPLGPNQAVTVQVDFIALRSTLPGYETNTAVTAPTSPSGVITPQTSAVPYRVAQPGYTVTKTRVAPSTSPIRTRETVTFAITMTNTGEVDLVDGSIFDAYGPSLIFSNAIPPETALVSNTLAWVFLGPVAVGDSVTVTANFVAVSATMPGSETNTAIAWSWTSNVVLRPETSLVPYTIVVPAAIGDNVWEDLDADGEQDGGEPGVSDVTVALYLGDGTLLTNTLTDAAGFYLFGDLLPDDYYVSFTVPSGFEFSPRDAAGDDVDSDPDPFSGQTATTNLVSAQTNLTLDAGIFRRAALGDSVWEDVNGDGIQDGGEPPITNVTVVLYDAATNALATNLTDAAGGYLFTNLVPGTYFIGFEAPTGFVFTLEGAGTNELVDSDADAVTGFTPPIVLISGETDLTRDAGFYVPATVGDTVWLDLDLDGLQGTNELGVANVQVTLLDTNGAVFAVTNTDATGFYEFGGLPPGDYSLEFALPMGAVFTFADLGGDDAADSDAAALTGQTISFRLASGDSDPTRDAGILFAVPGIDLVKLAGDALNGETKYILPGEDVLYTYIVINTGNTWLTSVAVTDDILGAIGAIAGPVAPGQTNTLLRTATNVTDDVLNTGSVQGVPAGSTGLTLPTLPIVRDTDPAMVDVVHPGFSLVKEALNPTNRPAVVREIVEFRVTLTNTGDVELVSVPLQDTYSTNFLAFTNANPPSVDLVDDGSLVWTNIGPLVAGQSATVTVSYVALTATLHEKTNTVVASPLTDPLLPDPPPATSTAPYEIAYVQIGDQVWVDQNGNGDTDEDLSVDGLNGVGVDLYRFEGGGWVLVDHTVTANGPAGRRGFYLFPTLTYGQYRVNVVAADVPSPYDEATTLSEIFVPLGPDQPYFAADFGFRSSTPTAVELKWLRALNEGQSVRVLWSTATETENLGFNLYRSEQAGDWNEVAAGVTRLNAGLVGGSLNGEGRDYAWRDEDVEAGRTYGYWLEDVAYDFESRLHGPVWVTLGTVDDVQMGTMDVPAQPDARADVVRIEAARLRELGVPLDRIDASEIKVWVEGSEVPVFVSAYRGALRDRDFVLFYCERAAGVPCRIGVGTGPDALRMAGIYAEPLDGEGEVYLGRALDDRLAFRADGSYSRSLLSGFESDEAWILDVTDPQSPSFLYGYGTVALSDEVGFYLTYTPDESAECIAVGISAVVDIMDLGHAATAADASGVR